MGTQRFRATAFLALALLTSATACAETGTVKFFNEKKGYGFIALENAGKEYYVHVSGLVDRVAVNDKVQFDLAPIKTGKSDLQAVNVRLIPKK